MPRTESIAPDTVWVKRDTAFVKVNKDDIDKWLADGWKRSNGPDQDKGGKDPKSMNKAELEALAADKGIELPDGATKPRILALLAEHVAAQADGGGDNPDADPDPDGGNGDGDD